MFNVVLYQPEIPPNTGNVIRLCANTGTHLHLIRPLGFDWDDRRLRRAGLDYHEWAEVTLHDSHEAWFDSVVDPARIFAFTTRARRAYHEVHYESGDSLLFGPETSGLPATMLEQLPDAQRLRIPMRRSMRSLNLSNAVAIAVYEARRQHNFPGER